MKVSARQLVFFALVIIFYSGLGGGIYFLNNRAQELGILCSLIIFSYGAILASFNCKDKDLNWSGWFFGTVCLVTYTAVIPGVVFGKNLGVSMFPSIAALRGFWFIFAAAGIYFLCRSGYKIVDVEKAFYVALVIICLSYLFFRYTFNLEEMLNSSDSYTMSLVTDGHRGLRLKPPTKALICLLIIAPFKSARAPKTHMKFYWFLISLAAFWAIWIQQGRSMMAGILFGIICYNLFWAKRNRLSLFYFFFPILIVSILSFNAFLVYKMSISTQGDQIRWESIKTAVSVVQEYPMLGLGKSSNFTITDSELYGKNFFPSDIGLFGVAYTFGLVGLAIYLILLFFLFYRAIAFNMQYKKIYGSPNLISLAAIVNFANDFIFCLISAHLTFVYGVTLAITVVGISSAYMKEFSKNTSATLLNN